MAIFADFVEKLYYINIPTLDPIILGTNCVRDKLIFSAERGGQ